MLTGYLLHFLFLFRQVLFRAYQVVILPYRQGRLLLGYKYQTSIICKFGSTTSNQNSYNSSTVTFPHGGFALDAVDFLIPSSSRQVCSSLHEKFRAELRKKVQVDGASFLPLLIALKFTEHVKYVRRGLTFTIYRVGYIRLVESSLFTSYLALRIRPVVSGLLTSYR